MNNRRIFALILCIAMGATMMILAYTGIIDDFWGGMGISMLAVAMIRLIRTVRFQKNAAYREAVTTEANDERNQFLRNKAWAWAGYLFVVFSAVLTIVLKVMGQDLLSVAAGLAVCLLMVLYWGAYLLLRKKY